MYIMIQAMCIKKLHVNTKSMVVALINKALFMIIK